MLWGQDVEFRVYAFQCGVGISGFRAGQLLDHHHPQNHAFEPLRP